MFFCRLFSRLKDEWYRDALSDMITFSEEICLKLLLFFNENNKMQPQSLRTTNDFDVSIRNIQEMSTFCVFYFSLMGNIASLETVCCALEKCLENDFRSACLRTEIFLRELTLSSTLNPYPKSSHSVDPQFSHKLLFYLY